LLFFTTQVRAQLSGTYTIGPTGSNYSSIGAAVTDLTSNGVNGAVTFNVASATYSELVTIGAITGASSTNTITFKGAGRGKSIISQSSSSSAVLYIKSASYINFIGFTIQNTNSSGIALEEYGSSYCSITNSNLLVTKGANSGSYPLYCYNVNYLTTNNCYIYGGFYGVFINGNATNSSSPLGNSTFSNNKVVEFQTYGFFIFNVSGYSIANNVYNSNTIDSSNNSSGYGFFTELETGATYSNNRVLASVANSFYINEPNYYGSTSPFQVYNSFVTGYSSYGIFVYVQSGTNVSLSFNTIYTDSTMKPVGGIYANSTTSQSLSIESNIIEQLVGTTTGTSGLIILAGSASYYKTIDGNDIFTPGPAYANLFGTAYYDYSSYKSAMTALGWETNAKNIKPVFTNPPFDLHLDQYIPAPIGLYTGVSTDIDGNLRCKAFPTAGAYESPYEKGKPTAKFYFPSSIYPGSPTVISQKYSYGSPLTIKWYLNGALISDSAVLYTSKFVKGADSLRLVVTSCGGSDSYTAIDTVKDPKAVPVVDFVSDINTVQTGGIVSFADVSSNGPSGWHWIISPLPTGISNYYQFVSGDSTTSEPQVQFNIPGKYTVCLTAENSVGRGSQNCKTDYITVFNSVNLGTQAVVNDSAGYLYDDGGPNAPYKNNGGTNSILINPCADSVYLTFSKFDLYCGNAYLKIYQGKDNTGTLLGSCGSGFTGGPTYSCASACLPNISKPDTFKAKNFMYIQMVDGANSGAQGFAAHWWSKLKKGSNPKPVFISSLSGDSVCTGHEIVLTNTTKIDPNDPPSFFWYYGSIIPETPCSGSCARTVDSFLNPGQVNVTLIASSCGGTDSTTQKITVYSPTPPNGSFTVDNQTPTLNDYAFFSPDFNVCIDDYNWSISKSSGSGTGYATFVNGTSSKSSSPVVMFSDTGYYDVSLDVDNALGIQRNSITKPRYIHVREPYCIPMVGTLTADIGIKKVVFNQITNYTTSGSAEYSNFVNTPSLSTPVELGLTYPLTVQRDSPVYNSIIRTVYIDWNQDGVFSASEKVAVDSNSTSVTWIKKITIPKTAKTGATVMRIAVNIGSSTNTPCGTNAYGEFQDYRLYVQPYHSLPVIKLKGNDTIHLELGYKFVEPGYTAYSLLNGDITSLVNVSHSKLSIPFPGGLLYAYNVTDSGFESALTKYRVVLYVKDTIAPQIFIAGKDTVKFQIFAPIKYSKVDSTFDLVTKILHPVIDTSHVKYNTLGIYPVYYSLTDSAGNKTVITRYIDLVDTVPAVLKLKGKTVDTIAASIAYKDSGVIITDNYYRISLLDSLKTFSTNLNVNALGKYTYTYYLTDPSGNKSNPVTRTIVVVDKTAPVITFKGPATDSVEVYHTYTDPGITVSDNIDKSNQIVVNTSGTFFATFPTGVPDSLGTFTIVYAARDLAGNFSSKTRYINVRDWTPPVITLVGGQSVQVCRWHNYVDSGYTVTDNYDHANQIKIIKIGTFFTSGGTEAEGTYDLAYVAIDRSGNKTTSQYRGIQVLSPNLSQCLSGIMPGLSLDKYVNIYPNPSSGIFILNLNLPGSENQANSELSITVTDMLGKEVALIHNGILNQNDFRIDLSNKQSGVYFLNIIANNQTITKRIVIAR